MARLKGKNGKFQCSCCRAFTLEEVARYDICGVCFWEDDGTEGENEYSGPNTYTLAESREKYAKFGACEESITEHTRPPTSEELEPAEESR